MPSFVAMTASRGGPASPWLRSDGLEPPSPALPPLPGEVATAASFSPGTSRPRPRGPLHAALVTARPRQWIKNALVIAAAGAAGALGRDDVPVRVGLAFVAFCLLSAGVYAVNDCRDVLEDRAHPRKRLRPIAAGELPIRSALALAAVWFVTGLALCFTIRPFLGLLGAAYVTLTLSYTVLWRQIVVLDIVAVAGGFVLRALAGGAAAPVALSRWFLVVVTAAAVFVAAGKRQAELQRTSRAGQSCTGRLVMGRYRLGALRMVLVASGACAVVAYTVWALEIIAINGVPWRLLTVVPFAACVIRYGVLLRGGAGEAPEETLLGDRWLLVAGALWLLLFGLAVHAAG